MAVAIEKRGTKVSAARRKRQIRLFGIILNGKLLIGNVGSCVRFLYDWEVVFISNPGMNSMLGLAVGICGAAFIGYCIYFDNKRRNDPNFKKRLRERRKAATIEEAAAIRSQIPSFKDNESLQRYFLKEVQMSEEYLIHGDLTAGVKHLTNAVVVCRHPQQLLNILNTTLPPQVFQMLLQQLVIVEKQQPLAAFGQPSLTLAEEDVE